MQSTPGRPLTVALFVPADRPERYAKAAAAGADAVIVDLEDAVAPDRRPQARAEIRTALAGGLDAIIRISNPRTADGCEDLIALAASRPRAIMIAKTAHEDDVAAVRAVWPDVPVIALIESIGGIERLAQIAAAANVDALAFGAYDLCAELGARPTSQVLIPWRSRIVFAARSAGRRAIDTPFLALDDPAGLAADAQTAVDFGFDGKLAVHPAQVAAIRSAFVPLPDEVARARRIVGAFSNGGVGVADGVMIDRPVLLAALRVLERTTAES